MRCLEGLGEHAAAAFGGRRDRRFSQSPAHLAGSVARALGREDVRYALTGFAASELIAPLVTSVPEVAVWVGGARPLREMLTDVDGEPVDVGANLIMRRARDDGPLAFAVERDGVMLANAVRIYPDLVGDPGAAPSRRSMYAARYSGCDRQADIGPWRQYLYLVDGDFVQDSTSFRWRRDVEGHALLLEFLTDTTAVDRGRTHKVGLGAGKRFGALNVTGAHLVADDYVTRTITAERLKIQAFQDRHAPKDVYDLESALKLLAERFDTIGHDAPIAYRDFLVPTGRDPDELRQEAVAVIREFRSGVRDGAQR